MSEQYQILARKSREFFAPILAIPLVVGVITDFWSHPNENPKKEFWTHLIEGNKAEIARRNIITSIPEIGPTIAAHIGNFGNSAAMMIPFTAAGFAIKEYGKSKESRVIETLGDLTPLVGLLTIIAINLIAENMHPENPQIIGDLIFGLGGALLANTTTQGIMERYQTKRNESMAVVLS